MKESKFGLPTLQTSPGPELSFATENRAGAEGGEAPTQHVPPAAFQDGDKGCWRKGLCFQASYLCCHTKPSWLPTAKVKS